MAAFNISSLADYANLTRAYELNKGGWVSLVADLPSYPLYSGAMVPRTTFMASDPITWPIEIDSPSSYEISGANHPIQYVTYEDTKRVTVNWSKSRTGVMWTKEEQVMQGGSDTELVNIVRKKKVKHDFDMVRGLEHKMAGDGTSGGSFTDLFGLAAWLPTADDAATVGALDLNGGLDTTFTSGITVADVPRWGFARGNFDAVTDDDLFDTIDEFMTRRKTFVPDGTPHIDESAPKDVIFVQNEVQRVWHRLQTAANDDLGDDLGRWRTSIFFNRVPVVYLPVISEPDSAEKPAGYGLLYMLDLSTWHLVVHSAFNFELTPPQTDPDVPDTLKMSRSAYVQLICSNRERNMALTTTNADLF